MHLTLEMIAQVFINFTLNPKLSTSLPLTSGKLLLWKGNCDLGQCKALERRKGRVRGHDERWIESQRLHLQVTTEVLLVPPLDGFPRGSTCQQIVEELLDMCCASTVR